MPDSLKRMILPEKRYNPAKTLLFGKGYILRQNYSKAFILESKNFSCYGWF